MSNLENALQQLREEHTQARLRVEKLDEAISVVQGLVGLGSAPSSNGALGSRTLSAAGRRRISLAQKARWAKVRARHVVFNRFEAEQADNFSGRQKANRGGTKSKVGTGAGGAEEGGLVAWEPATASKWQAFPPPQKPHLATVVLRTSTFHPILLKPTPSSCGMIRPVSEEQFSPVRCSTREANSLTSAS